VAVDPARVLQPERVEERRWLEHLLDGFLEAGRQFVGGLTDQRHPTQNASGRALGPFVPRIHPQVGEVGEHRHAADGRSVAVAVVVHDHDEPPGPRHRDMAECFVRHTPGEGTVPDHCDRPMLLVRQCPAEGVGERSRGVRVLDEVVLALLARRIPAEASELTESVEAGSATGQELVDICLVTHVPDEAVAG
jgi:hypothetical protein